MRFVVCCFGNDSHSRVNRSRQAPACLHIKSGGGLPVCHAVRADAAWSAPTHLNDAPLVKTRRLPVGSYTRFTSTDSPELSVWKTSIFLRPVYHLCGPRCVVVYSTGWCKIWTCAWVTKSSLWNKYLVYEIIHQSLSSHILVRGSGGKSSDISSCTNPPFMFSGNFLLGTLILFSSLFNTKVILLLCCKSPLSWLSASTRGNRNHFKDERRNNTTDNKELAEMLISSSLSHVRDQLQYPPFCQFCHVFLLYCVECRTLKWHICLSCPLFDLCFPFAHQKFNKPRTSCPPPVYAGGKGALD